MGEQEVPVGSIAKYSAVALFNVLLLTGCAGGAGEADGRPLPEGWSRVQVREGFSGREFENPLAGFTVDLPPRWSVGEDWPAGEDGALPAGWILGDAVGDRPARPRLHFSLGGVREDRFDSYGEDPEYVVSRSIVEGEQELALAIFRTVVVY